MVRLFLLHATLAATLVGWPHSGPASLSAVAQANAARTRGVSVQPDCNTGTGLYKESYALIVGESNYRDWAHLLGAQRDTREVEEVLKRHGFKVRVLMDSTRDQFFKAIGEFKSRNDLLNPSRFLLYFVGHGYTQKSNVGLEVGYIVPSDAPLPSKDPGGFTATAISMDEMETIARDMSPTHVLFVFDSCFSGSVFTTPRGLAPEGISARTQQPVRLFIAAGTDKQQVPDESIFREGFVTGLNGDADLNKDGYVTGSELGEFLIDYVSKYSNGAQTPRYGKIRDPKLDKGDFIFILPGIPPRFPFPIDAQYYPSGWMGDIVQTGGTGTLNVTTEAATIEGKSLVATRIDYKQGRNKGWAGIYWQHPENNWGDEAGFSLTGAKKISFYAKGARGGEIVEFISGGVVTKGKPFQDRFRKSLGKIPLTTTWTKYVIDLSDLSEQELSNVIGAFAWVAAGGYDKEGRLVTYLADMKVE